MVIGDLFFFPPPFFHPFSLPMFFLVTWKHHVGGVRCRVGVEVNKTTFHGFSIGEPGIENMGCFSKEVLLMDTKNPALFSEEAFKVEGEIDFFF